MILDKINEANDDQLRIDELNSKITNRIGVLKSSEVDTPKKQTYVLHYRK